MPAVNVPRYPLRKLRSMPEILVNCTWLPGVCAVMSDVQRSTSRIVLGRTEVEVPSGNTSCPSVAYGGGNANETATLLNGTRMFSCAAKFGVNVKGVPAVRKLSCPRFGSKVVIAPAA